MDVSKKVIALLQTDFRNFSEAENQEVLNELELVGLDGYVRDRIDLNKCEEAYRERRLEKEKKKKIIFGSLKEIDRILTEKELPYAVMKGFANAILIYGNLNRDCGDIDLLVKAADIQKIHKALIGIGYHQLGNASEDTVLGVEDYHVVPYVKMVGETEVFIEVHQAYHMFDREDMHHTLDSRGTLSFDGISFQILSLEEMFICLCEDNFCDINGYKNGIAKGMKVRGMVDLHYFVKKYKDDLDYSLIRQRLAAYHFERQAVAVIREMNNFYNGIDLCEAKKLQELITVLESADVSEDAENVYGIVEWEHGVAQRMEDYELVKKDICIWRKKTKVYRENPYFNKGAIKGESKEIAKNFSMSVKKAGETIKVYFEWTPEQYELLTEHPVQIILAKDPLLMQYFIRLQRRGEKIAVNTTTTYGHPTEGYALHHSILFTNGDDYPGFHYVMPREEDGIYKIELTYPMELLEFQKDMLGEAEELFYSVRIFQMDPELQRVEAESIEYPPKVHWGKIVL